ncbi:MAG: protein translocase subunit SecF [Aeromonadaceae bacterium]
MINRVVQISLTRWRYLGLLVSVVLTLACIAILATRGLHLGLDFTGGILLELKIQTLSSAAELNSLLSSDMRRLVQLQPAGLPGEWLIKLPPQELIYNAGELVQQLSQELALPVELTRTTMVGPQVGAELFEQGMLALLVASLAISGYLALRFEWRQAVGVLLSVIHDALVALGLLSLLQVEFDLNVIAGLMAVIGYSLNDSIVISDRLRDLLSSKVSGDIYACSDRAIKATFSRTLITSGTTLFTVGTLLLLGGEALFGFAFTLFVGVLVGTLSSITIASTVQEMLGLSTRAYEKEPIPSSELEVM